ncbi:MAG: DUF389 domain-containing protein [Acidobacteriota bacterium]
MQQVEDRPTVNRSGVGRFGDWFANHLGVNPLRKQELYVDISKSATLRDVAYWLQILFAAGIATMGLILNSPAVIIGAMLISPLMGPILAGGLSLAAGDLILGVRSLLSLVLSCLVAVSFAVVLVSLLPFREMTDEIAARTQPNTLDFIIALFSGAIGSIAICKEVKGVVTSIPGVAIAVALMPPLCVIGYGMGIALSVSGSEGMQVARGGGLLFLTNLVAITFTAMIVFLALHIGTDEVKSIARKWQNEDTESAFFKRALGRYALREGARKLDSLTVRFVMILIPILMILIPLSQSFNQLKNEIIRKQNANRLERLVTEVWQQNFSQLPSGEPRSYLDEVNIAEQGEKLTIFLRVFTSLPYSPVEKTELTKLLATRLGRPRDSISCQLVDVPTASGQDFLAKARTEKSKETPPTVAQLKTRFWDGIDRALASLRLPTGTQMVGYRTVTSPTAAMQITLSYLGGHEMDNDARTIITEEIRARFADPEVVVNYERIPSDFGPLLFGRNQADLPTTRARLLDGVGQSLQQMPTLYLEIIANAEPGEKATIAEERAQAIRNYLAQRWQVSPDRIKVTLRTNSDRSALIKLQLAEAAS